MARIIFFSVVLELTVYPVRLTTLGKTRSDNASIIGKWRSAQGTTSNIDRPTYTFSRADILCGATPTPFPYSRSKGLSLWGKHIIKECKAHAQLERPMGMVKGIHNLVTFTKQSGAFNKDDRNEVNRERE